MFRFYLRFLVAGIGFITALCKRDLFIDKFIAECELHLFLELLRKLSWHVAGSTRALLSHSVSFSSACGSFYNKRILVCYQAFSYKGLCPCVT